MTERIYYTEPACRSFDAVVTEVVQHEGAPAVVLDRTTFYPTSGGQPFDVGHLGTTDVVNTVDDGERVLHVVRAALTVGEVVHGEIDWLRRFDHMQQHTGQHVLSAAFDRVLDNRTMSFHMGVEPPLRVTQSGWSRGGLPTRPDFPRQHIARRRVATPLGQGRCSRIHLPCGSSWCGCRVDDRTPLTTRAARCAAACDRTAVTSRSHHAPPHRPSVPLAPHAAPAHHRRRC